MLTLCQGLSWLDCYIWRDAVLETSVHEAWVEPLEKAMPVCVDDASHNRI